MKAALLLILIIVGNLCLYWVLFGKKKFDDKFKLKEEQPDKLLYTKGD